MKEKKFFCDFFEKYLSNSKFILVIIVAVIISCIVSYRINYKTYLQEVNEYSKDDYVYLNEITNNIYDKENKTLTLSNIPDNVSVTNLNYDKEKITYTCTLDKDFWFVTNPYASATISADFNNIEITNPKKETATNRFTLIILSICFGMLAVLIPFNIIYIILILIAFVSDCRKQSYYNKKLEKFKEPRSFTIKNKE